MAAGPGQLRTTISRNIASYRYAIAICGLGGLLFSCPQFSQIYIQAIIAEESETQLSAVPLLLSAVFVTGMQLLVCGMLPLFELFQTSKPSQNSGKSSPTGWLFVVAVLHAFGGIATNYSMALIPAASTHLVKVVEPMITALIAWVVVGIVLSKKKTLGVILLVIGSIGATCNPLHVSSIRSYGVLLALLSSIQCGFRNVIIKHLLGQSFDIVMVGRVSLQGAAVLLIPCTMGFALKSGSMLLLLPNKLILSFVVGSAVCHATYTYISTCIILNRLSVIAHSLANVSKCVLVITLLYIFSQKGYLSPFFLLICGLGLVIYTRSASSESKIDTTEKTEGFKSRSTLVVVLVAVSVLALVICIGVTTSMQLTKNSLLQTGHRNFNFKHMFTQYLKLWTAYDATSQMPLRQNILRPMDANQTDSTMKDLYTAPEAVQEAFRIQMKIYRDIIGHYRKAILVGIGDHPNYGDSAITVGELMALNRLGIELIYYCDVYTCGNLKEAKKAINKTSEPVVILSSGGGNFCNWKGECDLRAQLVRTFRNHEVLVFPQSVDFNSKEEMEKNAKAMNINPNITYLFRDHKSYDIIVKSGLFKYKRAILCPDAAVQIGIQTFSLEPTHDILWLKRRDKESFFKKLPVFPANVSVLVSDWIPPEKNSFISEKISMLERSYIRLIHGFRFLSRGKVVVTDRLHGHILSVLLNKPNVLLDNSYQKLKTYHAAWTPGLSNVLVATDVNEAVKKAQELLLKYYGEKI